MATYKTKFFWPKMNTSTQRKHANAIAKFVIGYTSESEIQHAQLNRFVLDWNCGPARSWPVAFMAHPMWLALCRTQHQHCNCNFVLRTQRSAEWCMFNHFWHLLIQDCTFCLRPKCLFGPLSRIRFFFVFLLHLFFASPVVAAHGILISQKKLSGGIWVASLWLDLSCPSLFSKPVFITAHTLHLFSLCVSSRLSMKTRNFLTFSLSPSTFFPKNCFLKCPCPDTQ